MCKLREWCVSSTLQLCAGCCVSSSGGSLHAAAAEGRLRHWTGHPHPADGRRQLWRHSCHHGVHHMLGHGLRNRCVCVFACVERRRTTKSAEFTVVFYLNIISRGGAQSSVYCSEGQHEVNNFYLQLVMITAGGVNVLFMLGENSKGCTFASVSWLQLTKIYRLSWAIY